MRLRVAVLLAGVAVAAIAAVTAVVVVRPSPETLRLTAESPALPASLLSVNAAAGVPADRESEVVSGREFAEGYGPASNGDVIRIGVERRTNIDGSVNTRLIVRRTKVGDGERTPVWVWGAYSIPNSDFVIDSDLNATLDTYIVDPVGGAEKLPLKAMWRPEPSRQDGKPSQSDEDQGPSIVTGRTANGSFAAQLGDESVSGEGGVAIQSWDGPPPYGPAPARPEPAQER